MDPVCGACAAEGCTIAAVCGNAGRKERCPRPCGAQRLGPQKNSRPRWAPCSAYLGLEIRPPWPKPRRRHLSAYYRAGWVAAGTSAPSFSGAGSSRRQAPRATAAATAAIRMAPFIFIIS